jgi:hypothetical protein
MDPLELLAVGEIAIEGRMPWSSNATFLVNITLGDQACQGIYKPMRGERPLWDFPPGLHRREVGAYVVSEFLGWGIVPATVLRDGPAGEGSVQLFIEADFEQHYFTLYEQHPELHEQLRRFAAFDVVVNNTDRKGGHCLLGHNGRVYGIDHGLCFSTEPKLRTVIWEFGGEELDLDTIDDLARLANEPPGSLRALLTEDEVEMVSRRAERLIDRGTFPIDASGRAYPWPLV